MATLSPTPTVPTGGASTSTTSSISGPSCTTAVPGKYGHVPVDACNSYYLFDPSFEGNMAFAILFGLTLLAHIVQAFAYKKRFAWVVIMGALWECVAFILRTIGARNQQNLGYTIGGTLLFLLAPLWINAFAYMTVARLVYYVLPDQKAGGVKATWLTRLFVWIDIACFLVQGAGGSLMSNSDSSNNSSTVRTGQKIYMGGVGAQLGFIVVFCVLMARIYIKMNRTERFDLDVKRVKILFWILYTVLVLIIVRIIFRLVEFGPGPNRENPILTNENYAFGLDAFPMILALVLLNAVHPGTVLRGPNSEFPRLTRKERKQIKREKKQARIAAKEEKKQRKHRKKMNRGTSTTTEDRSSSPGQYYEMDERR